MTSPTQRSLAWLRDNGYTVAIVEHWNQYARIRQDLFGFGDLLAVHPANRDILIVQTTSGGNVSARVTKILQEPRAAVWLAAGGTIQVHGWRKVGPAGKRKLWALRRVPVTFSDYGAVAAELAPAPG